MKPLIIISPSVNNSEEELTLSRAYCRAIEKAGGLPLATDYSSAEDLIKIADGVLLSGGGDIDPQRTGDIPDLKAQGQISAARDEFEFKLLNLALKEDIPVLGICRGMQVIGAFYRGHIIQHIEGHRQNVDRNQTFHEVQIKKDTLLYKIVGKDKLSVNSFHHQAVEDSFSGVISAWDDGIIEAVELNEKSFVLGVQWHPEYLCETEEHFNIFKTFVNAAVSKKGRKK
ncbi:putative glutamine amidotransferase [bioreactor metagenome]|uniref:Putative glutamine amidotransferase n=1 Tax=bioreactor metagenome TaxID=1076179 RepID=A0A644YRG9_9ZZZZ|nr:gamma-glutamyl-gamma-aminobutyrate hydrolase family protein [Candidatus Metalachnospira sp.]